MSFYKISSLVRDTLSDHPDINVVTMGDYNQVDLNKQTIFPLAHIQPSNAVISNSVIEYSFNIIALDIVDFNKDNVKDLKPDIFRGNDNLQDVWASMLNVLNDLYLRVSKSQDNIEADESPNVDFFDMRFENGLAGCGISVTLKVENEHAIC